MHSADLAVRSRTPKGLDEKRHSFVTQPLQCSHSAREVLISGCAAPHVTTFHPDHTGHSACRAVDAACVPHPLPSDHAACQVTTWHCRVIC